VVYCVQVADGGIQHGVDELAMQKLWPRRLFRTLLLWVCYQRLIPATHF
jgi:hypothetical protein